MTTRHTTSKALGLGSIAAAAVVATLIGAQTSATGASADAAGATALSAMQRDLGLTESQAKARIADEAAATSAEKTLRSSLGADYAGSWFDAEQGTLVVAVTDAAAASTVRAEGAQATTVAHSSDDLAGYVDALDAAAEQAPSTVAGWYVDVEANQVVLPTRGAEADAVAFAKDAGVPADALEVEKTAEMPQPLAQGGDAYYIGGGRCSIGFAVNGGFVTAGHCGGTGATTSQPSGRFAGSSFPGNDYAYVTTSTFINGSVNNYAGGSVAVRGSADAPIGASICRSGSTTGWRCGSIQARNATVNYAEGSVTGLIRTNACAEPGDSGGSAISGNQAQGVTSGGSGNCSVGGTTFFQPVNEILSAYGLTLRTS